MEGTPRRQAPTAEAPSTVLTSLARLFTRSRAPQQTTASADVQRALLLHDTAEADAAVYSIDTQPQTALAHSYHMTQRPLLVEDARSTAVTLAQPSSAEHFFSVPQTLTALVTALFAFAVLTFLPQLMTKPPTTHATRHERINMSELTSNDLHKLFVTTETLAAARDDWLRDVAADRQRYVDNVINTLEQSLTARMKAIAPLDADEQRAAIKRLVVSAVDNAGAIWMEQAMRRIDDALKPVLQDEREREVTRGEMLRQVIREVNETNEKRIAHLTQTLHEQISGVADRLSEVRTESAESHQLVRLNVDVIKEVTTLISSAEQRIIKQRTEWEATLEGKLDALRSAINEQIDKAIAQRSTSPSDATLQSQLDALLNQMKEKVSAADVDSIIESKLSALRHSANNESVKSVAERLAAVKELSAADTETVRAELQSSVRELTRQLQSVEQSVRTLSSASSSSSSLLAQEISDLTKKHESHERMLQSALSNSASPSPSSAVSDRSALKREWSADIQSALDLYHADSVGMIDYALRSSGGKVVAHSPSHELLLPGSLILSYLSRNIAPTRPADEVLSAGVSVGECWPMNGASGQLLISLRQPVIVTAVTVEHADRRIVPDVTTAPREVSVLGVNDDQIQTARREVEALSPSVLRSIITAAPSAAVTRDGHAHPTDAVQQPMTGVQLGRINYKMDAHAVQTFNLSNPLALAFRHVRIVVHNNHGNNNYTCIYRIRVHGKTSAE